MDSSAYIEQLLRHSDNFLGEDQKILLLLTKGPLAADEDDDIKHQVSERHQGIIFKCITYEDICMAARTLFAEYEYEMRVDLIDDYVEYCNDTNLFDQSRYLMRIVPCGQSLEISKRHGIYFHPSDRGYTKHWFVGIYKDKTVQAIWKIDSIFDVNCEDGKLKKNAGGRTGYQ